MAYMHAAAKACPLCGPEEEKEVSNEEQSGPTRNLARGSILLLCSSRLPHSESLSCLSFETNSELATTESNALTNSSPKSITIRCHVDVVYSKGFRIVDSFDPLHSKHIHN
jgi:hypothetical protein